jgi:hypothetical protein
MPSLPYKPAGLLRTGILLPLELGFAPVLGSPLCSDSGVSLVLLVSYAREGCNRLSLPLSSTARLPGLEKALQLLEPPHKLLLLPGG